MPRTASAAAVAFVLGALPLTTFAIGCAASPSEDAPKQEEAAPASDLRPAALGELSFTERTPDLLRGAYTQSGTSIRFTLRREAAVRFFTLSTSAGRVLVESEYKDGVDTMRVFEGRAVQRGGIHEDGAIEGDAKAFDELFAMPEAQLVGPLKDALSDAKVDPFFVGREAPTAGAEGLAPKAYYDGSYWYLGYGEQASFATWSFWGWTTLSAQLIGAGGAGSIRCLEVKAGAASPEHLCGSQSIQRQWWGMRLYVTYNISICPVS